MKRISHLAFLFALTVALTSAAEVVRTPTGVKCGRNGNTLWELSCAADKPCFHPLCLPNGRCLTAARESDHPWHRGLWFSWKFLNGVNFWETDAGGKSAGEQRVADWQVAETGGAATVTMSVAWGPRSEPARVFLDEQRKIDISAPDSSGGYEIRWTARFTARERTVIDRTPPSRRSDGNWGGGYAGLSLRLAADFAAASSVRTPSGATNQADVIAREKTFLSYVHPEGKIRLELLEAPRRTTFYHWADRRFTSLSPVFDAPLVLEKGETLKVSHSLSVAASPLRLGAPFSAPHGAASRRTMADASPDERGFAITSEFPRD